MLLVSAVVVLVFMLILLEVLGVAALGGSWSCSRLVMIFRMNAVGSSSLYPGLFSLFKEVNFGWLSWLFRPQADSYWVDNANVAGHVGRIIAGKTHPATLPAPHRWRLALSNPKAGFC